MPDTALCGEKGEKPVDDGFNLYAYCNSNPVIYCDTSGFAKLKCEYKAGDKTARGREYSKHAAERANGRGFDSQIIDSIIDNNYKSRVKEIDKLTGQVTWRYQDKRGNTVITDNWGDKIVTVYSYPKSSNGGNYIPKIK